MTDVLGGESVASGQMKTTYGWGGNGNGTNSSGFSGLPGGHRDFTFYYAGYSGFWWSSSPKGLGSTNEDVNRNWQSSICSLH